ncbi:epiplakin [Hemicordylus capensis]|uniref:epiplakin n=1 Tax=Hemicordylus capensis TaxID=884348 RepID=UPI0023029F53|nr:epiplakin [Hemicordylus capensis]
MLEVPLPACQGAPDGSPALGPRLLLSQEPQVVSGSFLAVASCGQTPAHCTLQEPSGKSFAGQNPRLASPSSAGDPVAPPAGPKASGGLACLGKQQQSFALSLRGPAVPLTRPPPPRSLAHGGASVGSGVPLWITCHPEEERRMPGLATLLGRGSEETPSLLLSRPPQGAEDSLGTSRDPAGMEARRPATRLPGGHHCQLPPSSPAAAAGDSPIRSIAGVYVEASSRTMSLTEAAGEHLLQPGLALALLEAQAATGGLVDLVGRRLLSVSEAVATGLVGLETKEKLLRAERAATGFPDPYTEEKIPLYQAIQKELMGREPGLRLLEAQIATGGALEPLTGSRLSLQEACAQGCLDEPLSRFLSDPGEEEAKGFFDPNSHQKVTYRELMSRCIADPGTGLLVLPLKISFPGLRGAVCSHELLDSGIIDSAMFKALHKGEVSAQEVAEMESVQQFLSGTSRVAGVAVLQSNACKSLDQALREHLLLPGTAVLLLQAQAATGCLIDPVRNEKFTVDAAIRAGVVGPDLHEKLSWAERAVTGHRDPYTGETLSLFQAMKKGLVPRDPGMFLLDAQLATGGIVDPHTHHRLPMEMACQRGHLDPDTHHLLCNPTDGIRGFFEPNSKENLSYAELLLRCVTDPDTGLCLLPLSGGHGSRRHSFIDHHTQLTLRNTKVSVACGKFKERPVSLWKLLFSDYFTGEQRRALTQQFCSGSLSTQELAARVSATVQQVTANSRVTFEGLRDKVTPAQLLSSQIINQDLFEKLTQGETLPKDVVGMGMVKKYLEGTGSISGLLLPDSQEKISIYQAKRRGFLRPGTSLILLEAQAATGYIADPAANKKYSVDEALCANVIGPDVYDKLLAAEKAVTGYRDPYTGKKISLFQAMMKDLIVKEHAIRLLEAQIATGGIIDPVNSHRLPVEAAYQRGYFDKKMNLILSDPSDDTKGFFDPNTHENLTYLQLKEKCVTEPSTGLCLLPLNSRKRQFVNEATKQAFKSSWLLVRYGRFQGQRVSIWDLLNSEYFNEGKRREIFNHYCLRKVTLEQIRLMLEEEMKKWAPIRFPALRGHVTAYHLMETGIIDRALLERLLEGAVSPAEVLQMDTVRQYLHGTGSIGGIVLQPSNERLSLYEALKRNLVLPGAAVPLLEAQAATGFIIDPVNNQKLFLDDAVREGLVGPELYEKLQRAEGAASGYKDPFTGKKISLFQAMKKGLLAEKQAMQLMDAQLSTGGVIDPHCGHYVPVEFAQKKGYLDEDLNKTLSSPRNATKTFSTLDSRESVTYSQLMAQCQRDEGSGIRLLPVSQAAAPLSTEEQTEQLFRETLVGGKGLSLWELLHSGYFTEEQRGDFLEKYQSGAVTLPQLASLVLGLMKDLETKAQAQVTFQGLRGAVPAVWLLDSGIISEETFAELAQGRKTARDVSEMESVRRYLQGTGSIAGVFIQASQEKMGIYQAMQNHLLLPGMGTRLLEAQAATGSITDPVKNQRLGAEEAIKAGMVGEELASQLLQAERALTGYRDPYSGKPISVCQAIRKELLPASTGIPLLEAQLATGGVIDPIHCHHLPLWAAYKHGFYDEDMHKTLSQHTSDTRVFFDPNAQESLTYQQLKDRCVQDAGTGLWLLPLSEEAAFYGGSQTVEVLKSVTVSVNAGRFKGQEVSLWGLLNSEYITVCKRKELVVIYQEEHVEILQEIISTVTKIITETEERGKRFAFKGLRKQVSASDLFRSQLINKETLDQLSEGKKTVQDITQMESVRQYLEGCNFIAGVLIQPSGEKMNIYQAMRQGLLRPGAALVLLEAQAATGFLIDPVKNTKLSVDDAVAAGLVGREIYEKLLSAEKAVTGYTDPYTQGQISLFEAMSQELIVKSHAIRLLEAQIATGGIIDPVHSHRIPVEVAYRRGYFDEEMNRILSDPTDDTKGFFDPNTHENLTYLQLLDRCIQDPETGLYLLQIVRKGGRYVYIDEATKQFLKAQPLQMQVGRYRGQPVSMWDVLCSPYIPEQRRKELVNQYKSQSLTLEQLRQAITTIVEETEQRTQALKVKGPRGEVSAAELFNAEIIDKKTLDGLHQGTGALEQLAQKDSVKLSLEGTGCIAGGLVTAQGEKVTLYEAMKRELLSPENALMLLEAQAATGFIPDPQKKKTFSVDQAVSAGVVGEELQEKLLFAERAVTGYPDPSTGKKLSLFQAMKKNMVDRAFALRLLEAQMATGGIIDPAYGHRIPVEVAIKRGHLDDDTFLLLSDAEYATKGFVDPNTQEQITYTQLLRRCIVDRDTGLQLLQLLDKKEYFYSDDITKTIFSSTKVKVTIGKYRGQTVSLWELLTSDYIDEEKRKELIKKYKLESSAVLQHITDEILDIIKEKEENRRELWFQGLRQQVTAAELLNAEIITQDTMKKLEEGKESVQDIAKMDLVKRYLEGTSCIAGVLVPSRSDPSKTEKMTVYQAMCKGVLRPGTALVLLEAQAATGFMTDPLKNQKLSVDEAISSRLVGGEICNKLLFAEKAVTGYTDPYTGKKISLFQAMKQGLVIKEHGTHLLEVQLATGGIIDPVNSHRVPVEVAYKRGYLDKEMYQMLSDPTDDIKGFFDPNTHENLTYLELLKRCIREPGSGMLMLQVQPQASRAWHMEEDMRRTLKSTTTRMTEGLFQGKEVSLWDLLYSRYFSQTKREEIMRQYKAGKTALEEIATMLISTIKEMEEENKNRERRSKDMSIQKEKTKNKGDLLMQKQENWEEHLKTTKMKRYPEKMQGQQLSVWDVLFSKSISEGKREELLSRYRHGRITLEELTETLTTILEESTKKEAGDASSPMGDVALPCDETAPPSQQDKELESTLRLVTLAVPGGEFQGCRRSVWELLFSTYVTAEKRQELLEQYRAGSLTAEELVRIITNLIEEMEEKSQKLKFSGLRRRVTASELFDSQIIDQDTLSGLTQGTTTVEEITERDSVKRYLEGTSCIAGVLVPSRSDSSKTEKMTVYQAMWKGVLRPGTALVLLEAQAATGFMTDPLKNQKLSVEEAVAAELVGAEIREKLLSAERAVTGYNDPYTGSKISLFQAMKKGLIVKDHGVRLLEAQIATGGIIDPIHSHRLPVEVAYKRGYFDEEMNRILSDPTDDTKGFFDPNTHENLTYMQLLHRCVPDPDTGLLMLHLMDKGSLFSYLSENTRKSLQSAKTRVGVGLFQDQEVSVWDLLFSRYVLPHKRQELLRQFKSGTITLQDITQILTAIITETEERNAKHSGHKPATSTPTATSPKGDVVAHPSPEKILKTTTVTMPAGEQKGQQVLLWDLLFSSYVSEEKRTEFLDLYQRGLLPTDRLIGVLTTLVMKKEATGRKFDIKVRSPSQEMATSDEAHSVSSPRSGNWESALRSHRIQVPHGEFQGQQLSVWDLLTSQHISEGKREELLSRYRHGRVSLEELAEILSALLAEPTRRDSKHPSAPDTPSQDEEAPEKEEDRDAPQRKEKEQALKSRMVEVAAGEFHGRKVSVWDLLHSKYIPEEKRKELLQLYSSGILTIDQMETVVTAIVNQTEEEKAKESSHTQPHSCHWEEPLRNHTVVLHVGQFQGQEVSLWDLLFSQHILDSQREQLLTKYRSGTLSIQEMIATLMASLLSQMEGSHDREAGDASSPMGEVALPWDETAPPSQQDKELESTLRLVTLAVPVGEFQGSRRSVWELLFSKYVTAEKRQELLEQYRAGSLTAEELVRIITNLIEEMEEKSQKLKFSGLRRRVTASELFDSQIIDQDTLSGLTQGTTTVEEITERDSVKRYLEGTSCIAGVLVPSRSDSSKTEKMTVYQAMWKGVLRPGTALVLLEAQAATGFMTDPLKNQKLSVEEAVAAELVGAEIREKLLSAERAVTGYNDPYTGSKISLFQAMKKGLIVKDHGVRLLEAQIATGGIIDPIHSHRLPVEVAYKRGYFDEEMNRILSDPTDDTKGFFDPNTHENLTYMQLLHRCVPDPDTGLLMLHLMDKGSLFSYLSENTRKSLQSAKTRVGVGLFQDQEVSVWDLLFSRYVLPHKRQELLRQFKSGTITLQDITQILTAIITETEERNAKHSGHKPATSTPTATSPKGDVVAHPSPEKILKTTTVTMPAGEQKGQQVLLWDLLFSSYVSEEKRTEFLDLYQRGLLPTDRLIGVLTTLVMKKEATGRKFDIKVRSPSQEMATSDEAHSVSSPRSGNWESALRSHRIQVPHGEFQGQQLSVWDLLISQHISEGKREELLSRYRHGRVSLEELAEILSALLAEPTRRDSKHPSAPDTPSQDEEAPEKEEDRDAPQRKEKEQALKSRMVEVAAGEFHGRKVSVWDLLHSKYIPEEKRKELLQLYSSGILTIDQMETVVTAIVNQTEEEKAKESSHTQPHSDSKHPSAPDAPSPDDEAPEKEEDRDAPQRKERDQALKSRIVEVAAGEFHGRKVSVWDLLHSKYIPEEKRKELLQLYSSGILTIDQMETVVTTIVNQTEEEKAKQSSHEQPHSCHWEEPLRNHAVVLHVGQFQGQEVSLWDLLFSQHILDSQREQLLTKYRSGTLSIQEMIATLMASLLSQMEGSHDREAGDASSLMGEVALPQDETAPPSQQDKELESTLRLVTLAVPVGEFQGSRRSVWELLFSKYVTAEKRQELLEQYRAGSLTAEELVRIITNLIEEMEEKSQKLKFSGLRRRVTASELFDSQIIDQDTLSGLTQGTTTVEEITERDSVKRYLEGTSCIAGVLVPSRSDSSKTEKMTVYQAMWKGVLRPGTALVLLEAQAATGFMTDPLKNQKLSVEEAVAAELVGAEIREKLLSAERAVTGYNDPYTGSKISLFQAMKKGLIVKDHGVRLLEAQIATGGIIDPIHSHRLPVEVAYKRGYFDEEMNRILSDPTDDTKGFFDPNTHENLTYMQLLHRCVPDPDTGLLMLHLMDKGSLFSYLSENTRKSLQSAKTRVGVGLFQDQEVSVWDLLFSRYVLPHKRQELLRQFKSGTITLQDITQILTAIITETEERNAKHSGHKPATSTPTATSPKGDVVAHLSPEKILKTTTVTMPAGEQKGQQVLLWDLLFSSYVSEEKRTEFLDLYQRGLLPTDRLIGVLTTLVMKKEATGRKFDIKVRSPSQEMATSDEDEEAPEKEEDRDAPQRKEKEQALKSRMVEVAAGEFHGRKVSVWDLLHSMYIPEEKRKELLQLYTSGILTIDQMETVVTAIVNQTEEEKAKERSHTEPHSCHWEEPLRNHTVVLHVGQFQGQEVSLWDLLFSQHILDSQREQLLTKYRSGTLSIQEMIATLMASLLSQTEGSHGKAAEPTHRDSKHPSAPDAPSPDDEAPEKEEDRDAPQRKERDQALKSRIVEVAAGDFHGRKVSVWDLLHSKYIPEEKRKELLQLYSSGILTIDQMETVVTAIVNQTEEEKAKQSSHEQPHSCHWEEPLRNHAVVLHVGQFQGQEVSLWDLLFSQHILDSQREQLLTKYRSGTLSIQEMIATLMASLLSQTEGSHDREAGDASSPMGEVALPRDETAPPSQQDKELESTLRLVTLAVPVGEFQGSRRSVWELLFSKYVTAEKRQELLEQYRAGSLTAEELVRIITNLIEEMEEKSQKLKFSGLRRRVTASELFDSQIIDQDTLSGLTQGTTTVEEITERDSVKRYLEGTSCIAGVLVPSRSDSSKTEKMTVYQAMWKGVLRPGTALVLLEAQAATGFMTDPLKNQKLSVEEAVAAELVGAEIREKLLSAERAVTGYNDPYTGSKISLFQAMKKGLIVKDHGVRLLEAQIATGGIIDPIHSHRLPVEVAYKRGYFDEEMNRILSDPTDDTKGFFDPNTHENLTYMQLLHRCVPDPDTGLLMLHLMDKGSLFSYLSENTRKSLQSAKTRVGVGLFQDQEVSVWDLLFSRYVLPHKRQELLRQFKSGTITLQDITQILTAIITETEERNAKHSGHKPATSTPTATSPKGDVVAHPSPEKILKTTTVTMPAGEQKGQQVLLWDLLFSSYVSEEKRTEFLDLYQRGLLPTDRLIGVLTTLVMKKEATGRKFDIKVRSPSQEMATSDEAHSVSSPRSGNWESALRSHRIQVPHGEFQGQQLSVWDLLISQHISEGKREELLSRYRHGRVSLEELAEILSALLAEPTRRDSKHPSAPDTPSQDEEAPEKEEDRDAPQRKEKEQALKSRMVEVAAGEFHGRKVSVWDLLHSKYIPEEKRKELLQLYSSGILTIDQMETVVTAIVNQTEEEKAKESSHTQPHSCHWEEPLRNHTVVLHVGQFQGQEVSLWDLLFSQYFTEDKREHLLSIYRDNNLTAEELAAILSTLIAETTDGANKHSMEVTMGPQIASFEKKKYCDPQEGDRIEKALKSRMVEVAAGQFHGRKVSIWDLLHSKYIPEEKRKEILKLYTSGILTIDQMETVVTTIVNKTEEREENVSHVCHHAVVSEEPKSPQASHYDLLQHTLRLENIDVTIREVQGQKASVWDPFFSRCVSDIRREEILHRHGAPTLSVKESIRSITTIITEPESTSGTSYESSGSPNEDHGPPKIFKASQAESQESKVNALKSRMVKVYDQQLSLWDLLHSHYVPEEKKEEILELYQNGILTFDKMENVLTAIINKTEEQKGMEAFPACSPSGHWEGPLRNHTLTPLAGEFQGQQLSVWDLLVSQHISEGEREELLSRYRHGRVSLEELAEILSALLAEPTRRDSKHPSAPDTPSQDEEAPEKEEDRDAPQRKEKDQALKSRMVEVAAGEFHGRKVSVWDLLHSKYIPEEKRKELLQLYTSGILTIDQMETVVTAIVKKMEEEKVSTLESAASSREETKSSLQGQEVCSPHSVSLENTLRSESCVVPVGDFQGRMVSCWDLLFSKYISEEKRQELLNHLQAKALTVQELMGLLTNIIMESEKPSRDLAASTEEGGKQKGADSHARQHQLRKSLRTTLVDVASGEFAGQKVCVLDLLFSKYVSQDKRQELLELYRAGVLPIQEMMTALTTMIEEAESKCGEASGRERRRGSQPRRGCWKEPDPQS